MERAVGEVISYQGKSYRVAEGKDDYGCEGCSFESHECRYCAALESSVGPCFKADRHDRKSVIFKEVKHA